ncbi:MAG: glucokinase, partial [Pseudomonadota bacterium]
LPALVWHPKTRAESRSRPQQARVLATEAGHALLAPANETEARVLAALRDKGGPVSIEDVVSGRGIERIYETMGSDSADFRWQSAAEIFEQREHDPVAGATVGLFFSFLGLAARALALTTGAQGGVYVAGGIVPRYLSEFSASPFRSRFETPAPIGNYLPEIPTFAITHPYPALLGLAAYSQMSFS